MLHRTARPANSSVACSAILMLGVASYLPQAMSDQLRESHADSSMLRAPSVMSTTSGFEVQYYEDSHSSNPTPSGPYSTTTGRPRSLQVPPSLDSTIRSNASNDQPSQQQQQQPPRPLPSESPMIPLEPSTQQQAFNFSHAAASGTAHAAASSSSPSTVSTPASEQFRSPGWEPAVPNHTFSASPPETPVDAQGQQQQQEAGLDGGTARFISTPMENQPQQNQQQPFRQSHKPPHDDDDDDPFQQHSNAAVAHQQQQRTLSAHSVDISQSMRAASSGSFASTVVDQRQPARNSSWEEEKEFSTTMPLARTPSMGTLNTAQQQQQQQQEANSALAGLPSSVLKQKASQITALIAQFDAQFLQPQQADSGGRHPQHRSSSSQQQLLYPSWALPFVREMSGKLSTILQAQHQAEEREEEREEERAWNEQGSKRSQAESQARRQRQKEERQNQRRREAQESQEKVRFIEQQQQQSSSSQQSQQQQQLSATTVSPQRRSQPRTHQQHASPHRSGTAGFYPPDLYTVDPNASLPFLRDHGMFERRKEMVKDARASPRRNLGHAGEKTMTYYSSAAGAAGASPPGRGRPTSAKSAAYLTQLLGHDMNATMMNRLMRATSRSPSPPRRQQQRPAMQSTMPIKDLPGPTIPRAQRFNAYSTSAPLDSGLSAQRLRAAEASARRRERERQRELEMQALKIQVEELLAHLREKDGEQQERREEERHERERSREREERQRRKDRERRERERNAAAASQASEQSLQQHHQARSVSPPSPPRRRHSRSRSHSPSFDSSSEDALASALIRIGEANREKFQALVGQITGLQEVMIRQQEKLDHMAGGGVGGAGGPLSHLGAFASYDPSNPESSFHRERALAQQMHSEMEHLQRELQQAMQEKEKLASQVREMASHQEKHKFDLLEKVTDLSLQQTDAQQARSRDRQLLKSYESDLRASRDAITSLQDLLHRESHHAASAQAEKQRVEKRMEDLEGRIREKAEREKDAAYASSRGKLKPAARFQAFMHKYLASFYRREFQQLLAERTKNLSAADRATAEVQRAHEKHQLELEYTHRTHSAILAHVTETSGSTSEAAGRMREEMQQMQERTEQLEREREQREIDLRATEMLAQDLADKLSAKEGAYGPNAMGSEAGVPAFGTEFTDLMRASFKGDYLAARNDTAMLRAVHAVGDEHILFSDYVQRVDRRNKYQRRILLITDAHVLCLWADRGRPVRRVIQILAIRHISLSRQSADMFVLHYADEYDYLLISSKRSEIMYHLLTQTRELSSGSKTLTYRFGERVYVRDRDHKHRDVHVAQGDGQNKIVLGSSTIRPLSMVDEEEAHGPLPQY
jgi:hypothetical protein